VAWLAFGSLARELRDGVIVVGSGADADWRLTAADLMPRHFVLTVHGLNATVRPSSADVVVVLNGQQLDGASSLLNEGDVIVAGSGTFVFSDDKPVPSPRADPPIRADGYLVDDRRAVAHLLINRSSTLGRDVSNAVVIRDPEASRFHAEVRREAGGFALHTMGAAGTSLNGKTLTGARLLAEGDTIGIAQTQLRFSQQEPSGAMVAEPPRGVNDAAARRPTVVSDRLVGEAEESGPKVGSRLGRILVGVGFLLALAILAWVVARR
jgi:pSer/pThr/pTyr-binding forkhead associated (FHA) protein